MFFFSFKVVSLDYVIVRAPPGHFPRSFIDTEAMLAGLCAPHGFCLALASLDFALVILNLKSRIFETNFHTHNPSCQVGSSWLFS